MTNLTAAPVAPKVPDVVKPTAATPRVVPTVAQPTRVGWLSWIEQGLVHELPMIEAAANAGLELVEGMTPMGWAIKLFVGRQVVHDLIQQGMKLLKGVLDAHPDIVIDGDKHPIEAYVATYINDAAPMFFAALGPKLDELIKEGLAKIGVAV